MAEKILFKNARLADNTVTDVCVNGAYIDKVGAMSPDAATDCGRVIDCKQNLLIPGFYNAHGHIAMTLFRGYGEGLPLDRWLSEKIWPAEDRMDARVAECAAYLSAAEMIRNGTVSASDMYMFSFEMARVMGESGMKANISRGVVSFDPNEDPTKSVRVRDSIELFEKYNGLYDGRIKIDLSIHGEYTNCEPMCRYIAELASKYHTGIQVHLSETEKEHIEGIGRRGVTPTKFFEACGVFENRTAASHCVWVSDSDIDILARNGVFVVHNPVSNLKLGSGIMPLDKMLKSGICVCLGTDGASSNNSLSVLKELQFAAILHNGVNRRTDTVNAADMLALATRNGALCQGREDCGLIAPGYRADLVLIDLDTPHNIPCHDPMSALCYNAENSDVLMTVSDGRVLYENGEYKTLDVEKIRYDARSVFGEFFAN